MYSVKSVRSDRVCGSLVVLALSLSLLSPFLPLSPLPPLFVLALVALALGSQRSQKPAPGLMAIYWTIQNLCNNLGITVVWVVPPRRWAAASWTPRYGP